MRIEEIKLTPVWVNSQHLLMTAKYVMQGHNLKAVGVVDGERFIGVLQASDLARGLEDDVVGTLAEYPAVVVQSNTRIEQAAEVFVEHDIDWAPVLDGDRYCGMLTSNTLLRELRRSRDPLTGLPWSDRLREWGMEQLQEGREITIVFIDLDDFGIYNKRFGHIVGDKVLRHFVGILKSQVDPELDVLVRYGGDEFVIGTLRNAQDVHSLVAQITGRLAEAPLQDIPEGVGFTVGTCGGRRSVERENVHYAATLDNLINLASKECSRNKRPSPLAIVEEQTPDEAEPDVQDSRPRVLPSVVSVHDGKKGEGSLTTVILSTGEAVFSGVHSRKSENVHTAIAIATVAALRRIRPECEMEIEDVFHEESQSGDRYVTVTGHMGSQGAVSAVRLVKDDVQIAVAEAVIEALRHDLE
jgi:diguanylate cyclase (GGDEF)-like protein